MDNVSIKHHKSIGSPAMDDIFERFKRVIQQNISENRRWVELAELTEIPATSWNKAFNGKQRPTAEMIQAVGRLWPEYAFWMITGVTDARHGHVSCRHRPGKPFYPERLYVTRNAAKPYFAQLINSFSRTYGDDDPYENNLEELQAKIQLAELEVTREAEENALSEIEKTAIEALRELRTQLDMALKAANNDSPSNSHEPDNDQHKDDY
ncbi:hypothetical protein PH586_14880 [Pseudomonas sp. SA3-5]|uniref:XRE family transcriptional regulator n=1 Tax=Pseudomonas aestuarii TaxID=3018340 RepID=A0ABT4XHP8_9PSED|nr:hypothetical protein [Pseudomonas aestuarii]MDA7087673.1 hypothetical protein [Pseudomonas aestuarii]